MLGLDLKIYILGEEAVGVAGVYDEHEQCAACRVRRQGLLLRPACYAII